jgi:hypothetical protein
MRQVIVAIFLIASPWTASAMQHDSPPRGEMFAEVEFNSASWDNLTERPVLVAAAPVTVENVAWMRAYFHTMSLPEGSEIHLTSMTDGETQVLGRRDASMWSNTSAYFNGDTVLIEVVAGARTMGTHVILKTVGVQAPEPVGVPGLCGIVDSDDRKLSSKLFTARVNMGFFCTATVYCETGAGMVTAGHCFANDTPDVVQFNVPPSIGTSTSCSTQAPAVQHQFPITHKRWSVVSGGAEDDWGVCRVGTNSEGFTPYQKYGKYCEISSTRAAVTDPVELFGYGADETCVRKHVQQQSEGEITARDLTALKYESSTDGRSGTSGSALLNASGKIVGVFQECLVDFPSPTYANLIEFIDRPAFVDGRAELNACAECVWEVNHGCVGDYDADGDFDSDDVVAFFEDYNGEKPCADADGDSDADSDDVVAFFTQWNAESC